MLNSFLFFSVKQKVVLNLGHAEKITCYAIIISRFLQLILYLQLSITSYSK